MAFRALKSTHIRFFGGSAGLSGFFSTSTIGKFQGEFDLLMIPASKRSSMVLLTPSRCESGIR